MTGRLFLFLLALLLLSRLAAYYLGPGAEWLLIATMAVFAALAHLRIEGLLHGFAKKVGEQGDPSRTLINLENSSIRAELAARLDLAPPPVPLRSPAEHFTYPRSSATVMRLMGALSIGMMALICYLMVTDPSQRQGAWYDIAAGFLVFGGGGAFFVYQGWFAPTVYEVTDEHLALLGWRGRHRTIPWREVTKHSSSTSGIRVASMTTVIRANYLLNDYGRFVNLVLTRVPRTFAS